MTSEHLEGYSYSRNLKNVSERNAHIAPEAREALRGIANRKGTIRL
jgi:predicted HAD superfamily phosphohydrolase